MAVVNGTDNSDTLVGTTDADSVSGAGGQDTIYGGRGNDTLSGGADNDSMGGAVGSDYLDGGTGNDTLLGDGVAINPANYPSSGPDNNATGQITNNAGFSVDLYQIDPMGQMVFKGTVPNGATWSGTTGTNYNWVLTVAGSPTPIEVIFGAQTYTFAPTFNDTILGGYGQDSIDGGLGNDSIIGGVDNDTTGGDNDTIRAGSGDDTVHGVTGNDWVDLGDGNDRFGSVGNEAGNDTVHGGGGNDSLIGGAGDDVLYGDAGNDTLAGSSGNDQLFGGTGNDSFSVTDLDGFDVIDAGEEAYDADILGFSTAGTNQGVVATFAGTGSGTYDYVGSGNAYGNFSGIDAVIGTDYADTLDASGDTGGVSLYGWTGNDSIIGGSGRDSLLGEAGNDTVRGGAGNDTLSGGTGNDLIDGGADGDQILIAASEGSDTIAGGDTGIDSDFLSFSGAGVNVVFTGAEAGTYTIGSGTGSFTGIEGIWGSAFADTIDGGFNQAAMTVKGYDGNDSIIGGAAADFIEGGTGADSVNGGLGNDTLTGGGGNDRLDAGDGNDWVFGDAGNDTLIGGIGDDYLIDSFGDDLHLAGDGNDTINDNYGNDTIDAGAGNDTVNAGESNDRVDGGAGHDSLTGGLGNDTLIGGAGDDLLSTGAGLDIVYLSVDGGGDRITDFDMTPATGTAGRTIDQLDVSDLRTADGRTITWADVIVSEDATGNAMLIFPGGESVTLQGVAPDQVDSKQEMANIGIPCFLAGTRILTPSGWRRVEDLRAGDAVKTDTGPQQILWVGGRRLGAAELDAHPEWRPVVIRRGGLGNVRPLILSPQHCLLMQLDGQEVLLRARHAPAALGGACRVARGRRAVHYLHLLLPRHALICAEGAWVESLWPGRAALATLGPQAVRSMLAAAPHLAPLMARGACPETVYGPMCRPLLRRSVVAAAGGRLVAVQRTDHPAVPPV